MEKRMDSWITSHVPEQEVSEYDFPNPADAAGSYYGYIQGWQHWCKSSPGIMNQYRSIRE
jgi:hypothetical protein